MPTRLIREGIIDSKAVNALSDAAEVCYRRLFSVVDDYGRYEFDLEQLRAKLFWRQIDRRTVADVRNMLAECCQARGDDCEPLIIVYRVGPKKYLQINKFGQRERTSKYPSPDEGKIESADLTLPASDRNTRTNEGNTPQSAAYSYSNAYSYASIPSSCDECSTSKLLKLIDDPPFDPTPEPGKNPAWGEPSPPQHEVQVNRKPSQPTRVEVEAWFATEFWPAYPRRQDKQTALKWCVKHAAKRETRILIMAGLKRDLPQMLQAEQNGEKTFIPYPSSYLRKGRWKPDEDDTAATPSREASRLMM